MNDKVTKRKRKEKGSKDGEGEESKYIGGEAVSFSGFFLNQHRSNHGHINIGRRSELSNSLVGISINHGIVVCS